MSSTTPATSRREPPAHVRGLIDAAAVRVAAGKAAVLVEALPWLERFRGALVVVKDGGNAMGDDELKKAFAEGMGFLRLCGLRPGVGHGGGPPIKAMVDRARLHRRVRGGPARPR